MAEFRLGHLPREIDGNAFPLVYVTTAVQPEVRRVAISPQVAPGALPAERKQLEFWCVIVASQGSPSTTQIQLYDLAAKVESVLARNITLASPKGGGPPLVQSLRLHQQGRIERYRGQMVEAVNVRIRTVTTDPHV